MEYPKSELFEKLAAIEHERWADWQKWCHQVFKDGKFEEFMLRWEKQIATPYRELTEQEKDGDREQVMRYWKLIPPSKSVEKKFYRDLV